MFEWGRVCQWWMWVSKSENAVEILQSITICFIIQCLTLSPPASRQEYVPSVLDQDHARRVPNLLRQLHVTAQDSPVFRWHGNQDQRRHQRLRQWYGRYGMTRAFAINVVFNFESPSYHPIIIMHQHDNNNHCNLHHCYQNHHHATVVMQYTDYWKLKPSMFTLKP